MLKALTTAQISALHTAVSAMSFAASAGYQLTEASINSLSGWSIHGLSTLNAILGSTESSRAVAAIITLLKEELNKREADGQGEVVSYFDLLLGTVAFVLLQRWGRRQTELGFREADVEETIWDAVIDDRGFRAEVVGTRRTDTVELNANHEAQFEMSSSPMHEDDLHIFDTEFQTVNPNLSYSAEDQIMPSDQEMRDRIISQLPLGARAIITSETITAKTVKVDIYGVAGASHIEPPPGMVLFAEHLAYPDQGSGIQDGPSQTVVFRTGLKRSSNTEIEPLEHPRLASGSEMAPEASDVDDVMILRSGSRRSRTPRPLTEQRLATTEAVDVAATDMPECSGRLANQKKIRRPAEHNEREKSPSKTPSIQSTKGSKSSTKAEKAGGALRKAPKSLGAPQPSSVVKDTRAPIPQRRDGNHLKSEAGEYRSIPPVPLHETPRKMRLMPSLSHGYTPLASPGLSVSPGVRGTASTNYFNVREKRRDSTVSQTESFSIHSIESRPGSPNHTRTHSRSVSGLTRTRSEIEINSSSATEDRFGSSSGGLIQVRSRSFLPSLYSMATKHSEEAIILAPRKPPQRKSIFDDHQMLVALADKGKVPGMFPNQHLITTIRRFARFASASYGKQFLHIMGISNAEKRLAQSQGVMTMDSHHEHTSFSDHTGLPPDCVILSSFYDPEGVTGNTEWAPSAISPLVHFVTVDHDANAIVLTCRGTLGFEDVLTDMTCDYDDIDWQGQQYKVHRGIHAAARRLLCGSGSRVMTTIKSALEQYPLYGLVLTGHSLGGAVAALLAVLISEPSEEEKSGAAFVTAPAQKLLTSSVRGPPTYHVPLVSLPAGRPIHVYAYGTPATVSASLRLATRGLITTVINSSDVVPCLSLGTLHDFRAVALHLKADTTGAMATLRTKVRSRVIGHVQSGFYDSGPPPPENTAGDGLGEDNWAWSALKTLRAAMTNDKLVPPGEVFVIETSRVFDRLERDVAREAVFGPDDGAGVRSEQLYRALGRPATRVQFKLVRDVEKKFGELRFGRDMFSDHNPKKYESNLAALEKGILEP